MPRTPQLRQDERGYWLIKWAGKVRRFGKSYDVALEKYLNDPTDGLPAWGLWKKEKVAIRAVVRRVGTRSVLNLSEEFLANRRAEGGHGREAYYAKHLKRFLARHGRTPAMFVRVGALQALKDAMLDKGYAARTVNHDIQAVRTMFQWACDLELIPPVNLRGCRKLPLGEIPDKAMGRAAVLKLISRADGNLKPWLAICYLCALRPIEAVRIVNGQGEWAERGVMRIQNKARGKVRIARHVLFSAEAFRWWRQCEPRWTRLDTFSAACCRPVAESGVGQGPHRLRHSAATHLLEAGVPRESADSILGHYPSRVSLTYMRPQWRYLRRLAARITLRT